MDSYAALDSVFDLFRCWLVTWMTTSLVVIELPEVLLPRLAVTEATYVSWFMVAPDVRPLQSIVADHALLETDFTLEDNGLTPSSSHDLDDNWLLCFYNVEENGFVPDWP